MVEVYVISAFCKDGRGGNKAGAVLDSRGLRSGEMQVVAKALGYSETAFLLESNAADFRIRYFTPTEEVPLCGHATIAVFSLLHALGTLDRDAYVIETEAGMLHIRIGKDGMVFMEQHRPVFGETLPPELFSGCLEDRFLDAALPIQIVSTGLKDIMLPVDSRDHLERLNPDFANIARLCRDRDVVGIHAFALTGGAETTAICRNFAPRYGINEESATGTSCCALACYLFRQHKRQTQYRFEQGFSLGAVSRLAVQLTYRGGRIDTVYVGGCGCLEGRKTLLI